MPGDCSVSDIARRYRVSTRRSAELALIVGAWLLGVFAWILVDGATGNGSLGGWTSLISAGVLMLITHTVIRWQAPYADPIIFPVAATLNLFGLAMIHRLDVSAAQRAIANETSAPTPDVYLQIMWMAVGLVLLMVVLFIVEDHRQLQRITWVSGLTGIVLLFLPLLPGLSPSCAVPSGAA